MRPRASAEADLSLIVLGASCPASCVSVRWAWTGRYLSIARVDLPQDQVRLGSGVSSVSGADSSIAMSTFCMITSPKTSNSWRTVVSGGNR